MEVRFARYKTSKGKGGVSVSNGRGGETNSPSNEEPKLIADVDASNKLIFFQFHPP
ncbi:hypothetical protein CCACVL1_16197 [Corchorus capsularis]|uniref:Uncharacterized protein n=1 Tax=Corchorus capsularis TaxID=210143 RepID=A0A1R3HYA8_COCAP|nr:hypothetical protein CCACVL1_16197 [Corchorus capsularis]